MNPHLNCERCGRPLAVSVTETICPTCVAQLGQASWLNDPDETSARTATALAPVAQTESAGTVIGRYKLLEQLGEGGFGVVWAAEQREPVRRRVALKIIKLGMDTRQVVARFEAERQALAVMDHPNIAKVLDAGITESPSTSGSRGRESAQTSSDESQRRRTSAATIGAGRPYFVMELVKGISITKYCEEKKLEMRERLDLFIRVCQAIQHAHQKGIIHRDIKPSNILVTLHDGVPVRLLDRYRPEAGDEDLRGWEWRYLWKQIQSDALYSLPAVEGPVFSLAACPQGTWLAVAGGDQEVWLWDMRSRSRIRSLNRPSAILDQALPGFRFENFTTLAASPSHPWLAVSRLADSLAGNPDIHIEDVSTGQIIHTLGLGDRFGVFWMAFTADGSRLVALCALPEFVDWHLFSFSTSDGQPFVSIPLQPLSVRAFPFARPLALAPDGTHAFVGTQDGKVVAYDLASATSAWTNTLTSNAILSLAISADGRRLAAGTDASDPVIVLLDPTDGHELDRLKGHRGWIGRLQFLGNGQMLASSSADQTIRIWDTERGEQIRVLQGHGREIWELIQLSGSMLVSGSKTGELLVWDATSDTEDRTVTTRLHSVRDPDRLTFAPDGASIFLAQVPSGQVIEWGGESFRERRVVRAPGPVVRAMLFEPDGWRLAAGLGNGSIECFDLREPRESQVLSCEEGSLEPLAFNVNHSGLWVRHAGRNRIEEWIFGEQGPRRAFPSENSQGSFCWLAPGRGVLSMTEDGGFLFLDEHSGQAVPWQSIRVDGYGGGFSLNLRWFARAHEPGVVTVWDVQEALTGDAPPRLHATLAGALMSYHGVSFTPDSRRVAASSGLSQMVTLWDTESFESVLTLPGEGWDFQQLAFSPDGNSLISGGDALHIWTAPSWEEIAAAETGRRGKETKP